MNPEGVAEDSGSSNAPYEGSHNSNQLGEVVELIRRVDR